MYLGGINMPGGSLLDKLEKFKNQYKENDKKSEIQKHMTDISNCEKEKNYDKISNSLDALGQFLLLKANKKLFFSRDQVKQELLTYLITLLYYPAQPKFKNDRAIQFLKHSKDKEDNKTRALIEKAQNRIKKLSDKKQDKYNSFKQIIDTYFTLLLSTVPIKSQIDTLTLKMNSIKLTMDGPENFIKLTSTKIIEMQKEKEKQKQLRQQLIKEKNSIEEQLKSKKTVLQEITQDIMTLVGTNIFNDSNEIKQFIKQYHNDSSATKYKGFGTWLYHKFIETHKYPNTTLEKQKAIYDKLDTLKISRSLIESIDYEQLQKVTAQCEEISKQIDDIEEKIQTTRSKEEELNDKKREQQKQIKQYEYQIVELEDQLKETQEKVKQGIKDIEGYWPKSAQPNDIQSSWGKITSADEILNAYEAYLIETSYRKFYDYYIKE